MLDAAGPATPSIQKQKQLLRLQGGTALSLPPWLHHSSEPNTKASERCVPCLIHDQRMLAKSQSSFPVCSDAPPPCLSIVPLSNFSHCVFIIMRTPLGTDLIDFSMVTGLSKCNPGAQEHQVQVAYVDWVGLHDHEEPGGCLLRRELRRCTDTKADVHEHEPLLAVHDQTVLAVWQRQLHGSRCPSI